MKGDTRSLDYSSYAGFGFLGCGLVGRPKGFRGHRRWAAYALSLGFRV